MGVFLLIIASLCYVAASADLALKRDWLMAVVFLAYAVANFALIAAAYRDHS